MRHRLRQALFDRVLPRPEVADPAGIRHLLRHGSPGLRIRALRQLSLSEEGPDPFLAALEDPVPGVRRAAAWALGRRGLPALQPALQAALSVERVDHARLAMAVGAVRCGLPVSQAWEILARVSRRRMSGYYGARASSEASGGGLDGITRAWFRSLDPDADHHGDPAAIRPAAPQALRAELLGRLDRDPEDRDALLDLAAQQHPEDYERLVGRKWTSGRRESHAICEALGQHGDPRAIPTLVRVLQAMDVDPGHGFAGRKAAAIALGRIGDPTVGPVLVRAMTDEALDHEGRPGAGLGIQYPVRVVMLAALGEAGCVDQAGLLAGYLGNTHGSAMGGFYLPAMDALWKLGVVPPLVERLDGPELLAANALGVLGALGHEEQLQARLQDRRPRVAAAAAEGLRLGAVCPRLRASRR